MIIICSLDVAFSCDGLEWTYGKMFIGTGKQYMYIEELQI